MYYFKNCFDSSNNIGGLLYTSKRIGFALQSYIKVNALLKIWYNYINQKFFGIFYCQSLSCLLYSAINFTVSKENLDTTQTLIYFSLIFFFHYKVWTFLLRVYAIWPRYFELNEILFLLLTDLDALFNGLY